MSALVARAADKPRNDRWLKLPNVTFHFTPTRASWLNQVEIWLSILQAKSLCDESFTSVKQLRENIYPPSALTLFENNRTLLTSGQIELDH
jgi:hypothetical protein